MNVSFLSFVFCKNNLIWQASDGSNVVLKFHTTEQPTKSDIRTYKTTKPAGIESKEDTIQ